MMTDTQRNKSAKYLYRKEKYKHQISTRCEPYIITVFTVFQLLTDFVCLYTYEF